MCIRLFREIQQYSGDTQGIGTKDIVDAVIAELENRNSAAAEAEKQRIEAEKQEILKDLYLYGM